MHPEGAAATARVGRRIRLRGTTQGVGLRPWIHALARELGLVGAATNTGWGVEIEAWGARDRLDRLLERIRGATPGAVEAVESEPLAGVAPRPDAGFRLGSRTVPRPPAQAAGGQPAAPAPRIPLAPDRAVCADCLAEMTDPHDRRFGYPFTSCTTCGPRLTLARGLPWDRAHTSMADFPLCADCLREHATPGDRRHHAEANACPRCGPRVLLERADGEPWGSAPGATDALATAARALRHGAILAVRGVGGYHLVCDASDAGAVERLRKRKRRPRKPFAVLVADAAAARRLAHVDPDEEALLCGPEAPIVLLRRRDDAPVAASVAPGLPWLGLLLAYTPLHRLLVDAVGRPLVCTSGNPSGEPIATRPEDAARLAELVDGFLHHDREITMPCDDSVARVFAGRPRLLRRSRGWAPLPLLLPRALPAPVLGCGAQLASTVCLALGDRAWASPHLGDLEAPASADAWQGAVDRLEAWLGVRAEAVAHDLHPGYTSTRLGLAREAALHVPVQHHHAHVASAMAEHGLVEPVVGVAFDGTGLGTDGAAWGGEVLLADAAGFVRLASLRAIPLAGGEAAIRQVWRLALAVLEDAFDGAPPLDALPLFRALPPERVDAVRGLLRSDLPCLPAHGAGRWFDALGALVLGCPLSEHSGDVATRWNAAAESGGAAGTATPYPFDLREPDRRDAPDRPRLEIDLRPLVRAAVRDVGAGRPAAEIASRFHATLAAALASTLARLDETRGRPVVLTGGCFQNARLAADVAAALAPRAALHLHERVPPGDGGLAPGQAWVAGAALAGLRTRTGG